ncbi:putative transcriptional regulator, TetR family protein [Mycolicibacterium anyangense]|uniref:Putative transcriptional regulator, TetR family protein n=1 Tax=Mycolicibacterium anyangense TaxID=1431246 RepID=A0A6N4WAI3_9MYCO|nr:TetR/AcrR family transcriptional regulator [Mycolicibacterium anyangense]BBZ79050.1 putative transcriptional regulator, TetR family protein [Mycolicibacterium anyangense]
MVPEEGLGPSKQDRIVVAALDVFGEHGTAKSTLQMVAKAAGVSVGLVQHHFGSKDRLIDAVNTYALGVIRAEMSRPLTASPGQSVLEMGRRVSFLLSQQLTAVDYLARLLVEGAPAGAAFFDSTAQIGLARWRRLAEEGGTVEDLDLEWAALNPLVLVMGAVIMRRHIDRHLPEPFVTPAQLERWKESVNKLLERGQIRQPPQ